MPNWFLFSFFILTILFILSYIGYDSSIEPGIGVFIEGLIEVDETVYSAQLSRYAPYPPLQGWSGDPMDGPLTSSASVSNGSIVLVKELSEPVATFDGAVAIITTHSKINTMFRDVREPPILIVSEGVYRELATNHIGSVAYLWSHTKVKMSLVLLLVRPLLLITTLSFLLMISLYQDKARRRASSKVVLALPTHLYHYGDWQDTCVICLDDFDITSVLMTLPCGHEFHKDCISRWLLCQRDTCPLCQRRVTSETTPLMRSA